MEELKGRREAFEEVIESLNDFISFAESDKEAFSLQCVKNICEGKIAEIEREENVILNAMAIDDRMHQAELERRARKALANIVVNGGC